MRPYIAIFTTIITMTFCARHLAGALNYQLKNATKRGQRNIMDKVFYSQSDVNSEINNGVHSTSYTKTLIANYVQSMPPIETAEVIKILKASIEQHKVLPNVVRLKVPVHEESDVVSVLTALDGTTSQDKLASQSAAESAKYGNFSICGDTHGQFFDVMNIFSEAVGGYPTAQNVYLFNGDFVDRGPYSIEVILTLLSIKLSNPSAMHLLRGNHESIQMNTMFGFTEELKKKYPKDFKVLFFIFQELFCSLPIAAVVEDQVFVTHGGLGPATSQMTLEQLDRLDRFKEPEFDDEVKQLPSDPSNPSSAETVAVREFSPAGMSELLWSDPMEKAMGFKGSQRGGGVTTFGADVTMQFLDRNGLKVIVRSHQVVDEGFEVGHGGRCVTVFSAPNYCGMKNLGALIRFTDPHAMMAAHVISFSAVEKVDRKNIHSI